MEVPEKVISILMITHSQNPLLKTHFKFLVFFIQFYFISFQLKLLGGEWLECLIISLSITIVYLALNLFRLSPKIDMLILMITSLISTIAIINLFQALMNDFITFQSYYLSINSMIADSLLKGSWLTLVEVLTGIELAKRGKAQMGAFGIFVTQNFQISLLFALIILMNSLNGFKTFSLFDSY